MFGFNRRSAVALGISSLLAALGELPGRALAQSPAGSAEQRLRDLGIVLPTVTAPNPAAHIVPYVRTGKLLFVSGAKGMDAKFDQTTLQKVRKKVGDWNTTDIECKADGSIVAKVNGTEVSSGKSDLTEGVIGWQSEGAEIHFRNIKIKELK